MNPQMGQRCVGLEVTVYTLQLRGTGTQESPLLPKVESRGNCKIQRVHLEVAGTVEGAVESISRVHPRKVYWADIKYQALRGTGRLAYPLLPKVESRSNSGNSFRGLWNSESFLSNLLSTFKCEN